MEENQKYDTENVAVYVKKWRLERKWSQRKLAKMAGVAHPVVNAAENCNPLSFGSWVKIALALGYGEETAGRVWRGMEPKEEFTERQRRILEHAAKMDDDDLALYESIGRSMLEKHVQKQAKPAQGKKNLPLFEQIF